MKTIIKSLFLALSAFGLSVSCLNTSQFDGNDPTTAEGHDIVTIVDGSYDAPYYVLFDDGRKAFVEQNTVASSITFPKEPAQMKGEKRMAIDYNVVNKQLEDYDLRIRIVGMHDITTELLKDLSDAELANKVSSHTAPINIIMARYSRALSYVTLQMEIMYSGQPHFQHSIMLAHNKARTGAYADIYTDVADADSYLWLELYHDSNTDYETYPNSDIYSSYKIDAETLGINDLSKYKGVKIIYKPYGSKDATFYEVPTI